MEKVDANEFIKLEKNEEDGILRIDITYSDRTIVKLNGIELHSASQKKRGTITNSRRKTIRRNCRTMTKKTSRRPPIIRVLDKADE
ncbi:MAG: hypothetical protein IJ257_06730 [Treponema sp.]|nr:hypothetical protein [Treponema sp.]